MTGTPILADKTMNDWWWGASTVVDVWIYKTTAEVVLEEATPICGPAINAARPFLAGEGA
jgi:hypothetical protein